MHLLNNPDNPVRYQVIRSDTRLSGQIPGYPVRYQVIRSDTDYPVRYQVNRSDTRLSSQIPDYPVRYQIIRSDTRLSGQIQDYPVRYQIIRFINYFQQNREDGFLFFWVKHLNFFRKQNNVLRIIGAKQFTCEVAIMERRIKK